jgi:hypothetical protein
MTRAYNKIMQVFKLLLLLDFFLGKKYVAFFLVLAS